MSVNLNAPVTVLLLVLFAAAAELTLSADQIPHIRIAFQDGVRTLVPLRRHPGVTQDSPSN